MNNLVLACKNISKSFIDGKRKLNIFSNLNLEVAAGSQIAIMGRSGSGKTTLLQLLAGLDKPTKGEVIISEQNIASLSEENLCKIRNKNLGFIYQLHHLLPEFTALENVAMPILIANEDLKYAIEHAKDLLDQVGLAKRFEHRPSQLSGGERQRVAIARALANKPNCILADEPTGSLDFENANLVFELLKKINKQHNTALVVVTHDESLAKQLDQKYILENSCLNKASN